MLMPGGWTLSMVWMRMAGQSWLGATASFLAMWAVMTAVMMLPSWFPPLWRRRHVVADEGSVRAYLQLALLSVGYFSVWVACGLAVFPVGVALATIAMDHPALARAAPLVAGVAVVGAGVLQRTAWKARHLACCRDDGCSIASSPTTASAASAASTASTAYRRGVRLGVHCCCSCSAAMTVLLALGVMDLGVMGVVTTAITVERLAPAGDRLARMTGAAAIAGGAWLVVRAMVVG